MWQLWHGLQDLIWFDRTRESDARGPLKCISVLNMNCPRQFYTLLYFVQTRHNLWKLWYDASMLSCISSKIHEYKHAHRNSCATTLLFNFSLKWHTCKMAVPSWKQPRDATRSHPSTAPPPSFPTPPPPSFPTPPPPSFPTSTPPSFPTPSRPRQPSAHLRRVLPIIE